jgi:hypothetical protein
MSYFSKIKLFQHTAVAIFVFFMGMMVLVTIVTHARRSGVTGLDMGKVQQLRYHSKHIDMTDETTKNRIESE